MTTNTLRNCYKLLKSNNTLSSVPDLFELMSINVNLEFLHHDLRLFLYISLFTKNECVLRC